MKREASGTVGTCPAAPGVLSSVSSSSQSSSSRGSGSRRRPLVRVLGVSVVLRDYEFREDVLLRYKRGLDVCRRVYAI